MSAEKLPPDGFVLGPGWRVSGKPGSKNRWYYAPGGRVAKASNAESMGAIVRRAEAPTFEQLSAKVGPLASTAMASAEAPQILQPESLPTSENITSPANHYLAAEAPSPVVAPRSRTPDAPAHVSTWEISSLTPDKIIYELDGPRIFTSRDQYNRMLLAYLHAEHGSTSSYFVVPCSDKSIADLTKGRIAVRDALAQSWLWDVDIRWSNTGHEVVKCSQVSSGDIPPESLPAPGTVVTPPEQPSGNAGWLDERPTCDTPGCGRTIPVGGEGCPEICPTCLEAEAPASAPPEQPSRNPLQLPADAPAAPVGEPPAGWDWKRHVREANKKLAERDARIAALEAEVGARLVERDGWMEAAAMSEREKAALVAELAEAKKSATQWERTWDRAAEQLHSARREAAAAVQAERERCLGWWDWWWDRPDVTGNDFEDRIKNGDPAP